MLTGSYYNEAMSNPLVQDLISATLAMSAMSALICLLYWVFTGQSPWPMVVLGEMAGFGFGIALLMLTGPKRY